MQNETDAYTQQCDERRRDDFLRDRAVYAAYSTAQLGQERSFSLADQMRRRFQRVEALPVTTTGHYANQMTPFGWKLTPTKGAMWPMLIVYALGMIPAGYLSWRCNTNHGFGAGSKLLFGFFAGLGSWNYLIAYLLYKSYTCNPKASVKAKTKLDITKVLKK